MKKSVFYSAVALAGLPVVNAMALETPVAKSATTTWNGATTTVNEGVVTVSTGAEITQSINLLPGKYKVTATIASEGKVKVTLNGTAKTVAAGTNVEVGEVTLTGTAEQTLEIKMESAETTKKQFSVSDVKVTLQFDETTLATLNSQITALYNSLSSATGYTYEDGRSDDTESAQNLKVRIINAQQSLTYELYGSEQLYLGAADNKLATEYSNLKKSADKKESDFQGGNANKKVAELKASLDEAFNKHASAADLNTDYEAIKKLISEYETGLNQAINEGTAPAYIKANADKVTTIETRISTLKSNVASYDAAATATQKTIDDFKAIFNNLTQEVQNLLVNKENDPYQFADWLSAAKLGNDEVKGLDAVAKIIDDAQAALDEAKEKGTAQAKQADIEKMINDIATADYDGKKDIENILKYWDGKVKAEVAAYTALQSEITGLQTELDGVLKDEKFSKYAPAYQAELTKLGKTMQAEIDKLQETLDGYIKAHESVGKTLDKTAANKAMYDVEETETEAQDARNLYDTIVKDNITDVETKYNTAKTAAAKLQSTDKKYKPADKMTAYQSDVESKIAARKTKAKEAYDNLGVGKQYKVTFDDVDTKNGTSLVTLVDDYVANVTSALTDKYNTVTKTISDKQKALSTRKGEIENLEVYTLGDDPYNVKVEAAQTKISEVQAALDAALAKVGKEHWTAMTALDDQAAAIQALIDALASAETDNAAYKTKADADAHVNIYNNVMASYNQLTDDLATFETTYSPTDATKVGLKYNDAKVGIESDYTTLKTEIENYLTTINANNALADEPAIVALNNALGAVSKLQERLTALSTKAAQLKTAFDQNTETYNGYMDAKTGTFTKLQKQWADTETALKKNNDAKTGAKDVYPADFGTEQGEITAALTALQAAIENSKDNETLNVTEKTVDKKDYTGKQLHDAEIERIQGLINTLNSNALAAQKLYTAYEGLKTLKAQVAGTLSDENSLAFAKDRVEKEDKAKAVGGGAWDEFFKPMFTAWETALGKVDLKSQYSDLTDKQVTDYNNTLTQMQKDYKALTATPNVEAYDKQLAAYEKAQAQWNETNVRITGTDQSTILQDWKDSLATYQEQINALKAKVDEAYLKNEAQTLTTAANEFSEIEAAIKTLDETQNAAYEAAVKVDNEAALASFDNKVILVGNVLAEANTMVNAYKSLQSEELATAVNDIITAAKTLTDKLYSYPTQLQTLNTNAHNDYDKVTKDPKAFWDTDSTFNNDAKSMLDALNTDFSQFKKDVANAVKAQMNYLEGCKSNLNGALTNYVTGIPGYDKNNKTAILMPITDLVALIDKAIALRDKADQGVSNVVDLDQLIQQNPGLGSNAKLDNASNVATSQAAANVIEPQIAALEAEYAEGVKTLSGNDETKYTTLYNYSVKLARQTFDNAVENNQLNIQSTVDYIMQLLEDFETSPNNVVKNNETKAANLEAINADIVSLRDQLAKARTFVADYIVAPELTADFDTQEDLIDELEAQADYYAVNYASYQSQSKSISGDLLNLRTNTLINKEADHLTNDVNDLKAEYNNLAAKNVLNDELKALEKDINALNDKISAAKVKALTKDKKGNWVDANIAELLKVEQEIAALRAQLAQANEDNIEGIAGGLNDAIDEFISNSREELEGYTEVKDDYSEQLEEQLTQLAAIKDEIAAHKEAKDLGYYESSINDKIQNIEGKVTELLAKAKTENANKVANATAKANMAAEVEALQTLYNEAIELIDNNYSFVNGKNNYGQYNDSYMLDYVSIINLYINNAQNYAKNYAGFNADEKLPTNYTSKVNNFVSTLKLYAAYNDVLNACQDAKTKTGTGTGSLKLDYAGMAYSTGTQAIIDSQTKDIRRAISTLENDAANSRYGYDPVADITGDPTIVEDHDALIERVNAINEQVQQLIELYEKNQQGDLDGNGRVGVSDYSKVLDAVLNGITAKDDEVEMALYDVTGDGEVNIGDAQAIVNLILYQKTTAPAAARATVKESVSMEVISQEGMVQRIAVNLSNATHSYAGMQADIVLPQGASIAGVSLTDRSNRHELYTREQADGSLRIVASTFEKNGFNDREGAVLYIDVQNSSNESIELKNVILADNFGNVAAFEVSGKTSAIESLKNAASNMIDKVYNVGGKMMNGLRKGINIIRNADGSTTKVVEK